jgi:hypothetical protein
MKLLLALVITMFSIQITAGEVEIRALFDAWFEKHKNDVENQLASACSGPECYQGRDRRNPERTDPVYKSWKQLRRQLITYQEFDRAWDCGKFEAECPTQWKAFKENYGHYDDFAEWSRNNVLKYNGHWSNIDGSLGYGPPPESFLADRVDSSGLAVNDKGELTPTGGGNKTMFKYFILPLILSLISASVASANGKNGAVWATGTILAYGCATDLMAVLGFFFSLYLFFAVALIFAFSNGVKLVMAIARK